MVPNKHLIGVRYILYVHCEVRKKWDFIKPFFFIFTGAQLQRCTIELVLNHFRRTGSCTIELVLNHSCITVSCTIEPVPNRFCITDSCTIEPVPNPFCLTDSCTIEPVLNRWRVQSIRCSVILVHNRFVHDQSCWIDIVQNRAVLDWCHPYTTTKVKYNIHHKIYNI